MKYIKLYSQFTKFLENIDATELTVYEKKLLNLITHHFDEIAETGISSGKRARLLAELITKEGRDVPDVINFEEFSSDTTDFAITKLKSLHIENFRGFSKIEEFDFDKQFTLIYGPNGSGKSGFCDALEFCFFLCKNKKCGAF